MKRKIFLGSECVLLFFAVIKFQLGNLINMNYTRTHTHTQKERKNNIQIVLERHGSNSSLISLGLKVVHTGLFNLTTNLRERQL